MKAALKRAGKVLVEQMLVRLLDVLSADAGEAIGIGETVGVRSCLCVGDVLWLLAISESLFGVKYAPPTKVTRDVQSLVCGRIWPIDLAKECNIYISSRSGSRKKTPIACGYTEDPFKNRSRNYKPKSRDSYPQNLERQNKNCYVCDDSSHYARDREKHFKPKESNSHIYNRKNANSLKVKSEKQQKGDEFAQQLQYENIFVENQTVIALIDSSCQISVLNSSLIRLNNPSEGRITLNS
ncbi:hypothetical protein TNCV_1990821 [Trichonephila clavipes]|nr:hypothetical protein TNCV_1990821 [Trichonephila clavipes]